MFYTNKLGPSSIRRYPGENTTADYMFIAFAGESLVILTIQVETRYSILEKK